MSPFYRKPKPETMKKNREIAKQQFAGEMSWLKENVSKLTMNKNKFLLDMYQYLISGSRKITPKMGDAIRTSIGKCKVDARYNENVRIMEEVRLEPILEKIAIVEKLAESKNDGALEFVQSVKNYVKTNYRITKKQMDGLNKVYKRVSEDLFNKEGDKDGTQ